MNSGSDKLKLSAFTVIAGIILVVAAPVSVQVPSRMVDSAATLDSVPYWLNDKEWMKIVDGVTAHDTLISEIIDKHILAWFSRLDCDEFDHACDTTLHALVEIEYHTVEGIARWVVAWLLRPPPPKFRPRPPMTRQHQYPGWILAATLRVDRRFPVSSELHPESDSTSFLNRSMVDSLVKVDTLFFPLRVFNHPPNNNDIYATVAATDPDDTGFFDAAESRFIDGDVRERTWKAVVGEAPTRSFPNGK